MHSAFRALSALPVIALFACNPAATEPTQEAPSVVTFYGNGTAKSWLNPASTYDTLATGFSWSEGPLWIPQAQVLIFTDVPQNKAYQWHPEAGLSVYLEPSGLTRTDEGAGRGGANGLALDRDGLLVLCQHGDRRLARMDAPVVAPISAFTTLADQHAGLPFNSPNDLVMGADGSWFFTDPPYGAPEGKTAEMGLNGVYLLDTAGQTHLLVDTLSRPNGIGLSPDGSRLYVNQSDPEAQHLYAFNLDATGAVISAERLFDFTPLADAGGKGLPDGLKVHSNGNIFATGPGGVHVISPEGELLATIHTGKATANCALDEDGGYLYLTSSDALLRISLK